MFTWTLSYATIDIWQFYIDSQPYEGTNKGQDLQNKVCSIGTPGLRCSCKNDIIYALILNNKVRRLTFSKDLAYFIQGKNKDHAIYKLDLVPCEEINSDPGNCLFGIVGHKGFLLRATALFEEAKFLTENSNRKIVACRVRNKELEREGSLIGGALTNKSRVDGSSPSLTKIMSDSLIGKALGRLEVDGSSPSPSKKIGGLDMII